MDKYSYTIAWSEDDRAYVALSPEFPGLSGTGDTVDAAIAELQTALDLAVETYQEEGWDLPKPHYQQHYSGKLLVRMPKSLHQALAQHAEVEGVSLNLLVVTLLGRGLGQRTSVTGHESTLVP